MAQLIPKEFDGTIYFLWEPKHEYLYIAEWAREDVVILGEVQMKMDFDVEQATLKTVELLEEKLETLEQTHQQQVLAAKDHIQSLRALTYTPS